MPRIKRDENNVPIPVKTEAPAALNMPTAAERFGTNDSGKEKPKGKKHSGKPIGEEEIAKARDTMVKYFRAKKAFDDRYAKNFEVYNLAYTEQEAEQYVTDGDGNVHKKLIKDHIGAQTLNVIMNKHADAMDNYPEPILLPRARDDEHTAQMLSSIIPCILERNNYQATYSETWYDKLVGGADAVSVTWDKDAEKGLGDIRISRVDILSLAWEPYIENIQDSENVFCLSYEDVERIRKEYPELENVSTEDLGLSEIKTYDSRSKTENKAALIDWYYKKDGLLHFCKFCGSHVLFASENEAKSYPKGFYEHGKYPFVIGKMFPLRDTPVGFSFIDICRAPQEELDSLKRDILKNVKVNSQTRNIVDENAIVNFEDLADLNKEFIAADNLNAASRILVPLETKDIAGGALSMYSAITDEIKMTTGTNDAASGASAAGVTSGSAIAALQEAGGKISRDINKAGFREFMEICELIIENIRQFYNPGRWFRIVGEDKKPQYVQFDNEGLMPQDIETEGSDEDFKRLPVFDIQVKAQRSNPFTTAANNQLMIDMFRMGVFAPENADAAIGMLECMSFEGKDKLMEKVRENAQLLQAVQQMQGRLQMQDAMIQQQAAQQIEPTQPTPPAEPVQLPVNQSQGARI